MDKIVNKTQSVTVRNEEGLRSRPVIQFISVLNRFRRTEIKISHSNKTVNAKSLLGVLSLGLERGAVFEVSAHGPEQEVDSALKKIQSMAESGFTQEACS